MADKKDDNSKKTKRHGLGWSSKRLLQNPTAAPSDGTIPTGNVGESSHAQSFAEKGENISDSTETSGEDAPPPRPLPREMTRAGGAPPATVMTSEDEDAVRQKNEHRPGAFRVPGMSGSTTCEDDETATMDDRAAGALAPPPAEPGVFAPVMLTATPVMDEVVEAESIVPPEGARGLLQQRRTQVCLVFVMVLLVALAAVLGATLSSAPAPSPATPTDPTPPQPTMHPSARPSEEMSLMNLLISVSPDSGAALTNPLSPQYAAYLWLSDVEKLSLYTEARIIQLYALATLFYSTSGDRWVNNTGWLNATMEECNWFGVTCTPLPSRNVSGIDLSRNELHGSLPEEVVLLANSLEVLKLEHNGISGSITNWLLSFVNAREIDISHNSMTARIPEGIGNLTWLVRLDLKLVTLTGTVPSELGMLENLEYLYVSNNMLKGQIPSELGNLIRAKHLWFHYNSITGTMPSEVCNLRAGHSLNSLKSDCDGMPPQINCTCCTDCLQ